MVGALYAATMPDGSPSTPRGFVHLLVAFITLVCIVGVIILAFVSRDVPEILSATATVGIGYLAGSAVTARGNN